MLRARELILPEISGRHSSSRTSPVAPDHEPGGTGLVVRSGWGLYPCYLVVAAQTQAGDVVLRN